MKNNQQKNHWFINFSTYNIYVTFNITNMLPCVSFTSIKLQHVQRTYWNYCISKNAYKELWLSRHAWSLTWPQMPNEGDNVPPTNFQRLDSGVRTRGSEIKERGKETAKKAEKEKKTESNWNKFAAIAYLEEAIVWGTFQNVTWLCSG